MISLLITAYGEYMVGAGHRDGDHNTSDHQGHHDHHTGLQKRNHLSPGPFRTLTRKRSPSHPPIYLPLQRARLLAGRHLREINTEEERYAAVPATGSISLAQVHSPAPDTSVYVGIFPSRLLQRPGLPNADTAMAYSREKDEANWPCTRFSGSPYHGSPSAAGPSRRDRGIVKTRPQPQKSQRTASSRCSPWIFRNARSSPAGTGERRCSGSDNKARRKPGQHAMVSIMPLPPA